MSYMSEKKAKEVFGQYQQAEASGNDTLAIQLERDLNNAGWFITAGQDGLTVARKDSILDASAVDWIYTPKESTVAPNSNNDNPNEKMWRNIGIAVLITIGVILLIVASVKIYKVIKNRQNATA